LSTPVGADDGGFNGARQIRNPTTTTKTLKTTFKQRPDQDIAMPLIQVVTITETRHSSGMIMTASMVPRPVNTKLKIADDQAARSGCAAWTWQFSAVYLGQRLFIRSWPNGMAEGYQDSKQAKRFGDVSVLKEAQGFRRKT